MQLHFMDLTSDDKEIMRLNPKHLPNLILSDRRSSEFYLSLGLRVVYGSSFVRLPVYVLTECYLSAFRSS